MYVEGFWWKSILTIGSLSLIGIVTFGSVVGIRSCTAPPVNRGCVESAEIVSSASSRRECEGGGRVVTEQMQQQGGTDMLQVRCLCTHDADAGMR